jgi:two-component SAPR family response regulator
MLNVDPFRGRRILLVEDDYLIATELARFFSSRGATVIGPAGTVSAALRLLERTEEVDLAMIDMNLRGEMAFPIADKLQERGIRFAFATGYDEDAIPSRYRAVPRCEKPVSPARIEAAFS